MDTADLIFFRKGKIIPFTPESVEVNSHYLVATAMMIRVKKRITFERFLG